VLITDIFKYKHITAFQIMFTDMYTSLEIKDM